MEKLLQGVTPLLQNFEMNLMPILCRYISQVLFLAKVLVTPPPQVTPFLEGLTPSPRPL